MALNDIDIRPQLTAHPRQRVNPDARAGLKSAITNNQPLQAMEYIGRIVEDQDARIAILEVELATAQKNKPSTTRAPKATEDATPIEK